LLDLSRICPILIRQIDLQLAARVSQIAFVDDVIPLKDRSGFMAADRSGNALWHTRPDEYVTDIALDGTPDDPVRFQWC
jgi:hypothetical protein